ncbi:MAG: DUF4012 domain-containing protein [Patescibacteria group bacterium]|nr:DUF4012 domain-containing protein [Patescibacteria group bacterium]
MTHKSPNFLTCPIYPESPPPKKQEDKVERVEPSKETPTKGPLPQESFALRPVVQPGASRNGEGIPGHAQDDRKISVEEKKASRVRPKFGMKKPIIAGVLVVVLLVAIFTVPAVVAGVQALLRFNSAKIALNAAADSLKKLDVGGAADKLDEARDELTAAQENLKGVGFWRDMPGVGTQIKGLEGATAAGISTLDGVGELLQVFRVVTDALQGGAAAEGSVPRVGGTRSYGDLSAEEKRDMLQKLDNALPKLRMARDNIDLAVELWSRVPQDELYAPLRTALKPLADNLPVLRQALDQSVPLVEVLIPLAGYPNQMRYLLLLQNTDEIRPTGGFIGNIGLMTMDAGEMTEIAFADVYKLDGPAEGRWKAEPPLPIKERLGLSTWYFRDANWSPDFPTSAETLLDFYAGERASYGATDPHPPTAVVALNPSFFKSLLHLTGSLEVDGKVFDENNFFDRIQYEVEQGFFKEGVPVSERKAIISKLGEQMVSKIEALPAARWGELLDVVTKALERKQIMAYARDPAVLTILDKRAWTARAKATRNDYLWVVDANLGALKTDGVMDKNVKYELDATDPQGSVATVTLTYKNTNKTIDWRYTRYRSYTRVYVPDGSQLITSSGAMKDDRYRTGGVSVPGRVDVTHELGKTVLGAFWSIEPGQTGTLKFKYRLPQSVAEKAGQGEYILDWQKQSGADKTGLTLDLKFGKNIRSAIPGEDQEKWGDARYEYKTDSLVDRTFEVKL